MGILGLLPALRGIQERVGHQTRVGLYDQQFSGSRVAVDGYVLLHRFASGLGTAQALVLSESPDRGPLIEAVVRAHRNMKAGGLHTVTVFDGMPPPGKNKEKEKRRSKSAAALANVRASQGQRAEPDDSDVVAAVSRFLNAETMAAVADALHTAGFSAHVALTEADGQLAHLARTGQVDHVLTIDSDLVAHGCPSVLMIPAVGRRARADGDGRPAPRSEGDRFDFTTGRTIHLYKMAALCSDSSAAAVLAAAEGPPKASEAEGLAIWLGAMLHRAASPATGHGVLQVFGAIVKCDYGTVKGAGPQFAVEVMHEHFKPGVDGGWANAVAAALSKKVGLENRRKILHEEAKAEHGDDAVAPDRAEVRARGDDAAKAAIKLIIKRTLVCFREPLVFDQPTRQVLLLSQAVAEPMGSLDRKAHAKPRRTLGGKSLADLVGVPPADQVAREIWANRSNPVTQQARSPHWQDDSLHDVQVTSALIQGARLQPPVFEKEWAALLADEQEIVEALGLNEGTWPERFEGPGVDGSVGRGRWPKTIEAMEDEALQTMVTGTLGFNEPQFWPPRPCDTAAAIEKHFTGAVLDRFLKCRDVKGASGQLKGPKSEMVFSIMQEEAALLALGQSNSNLLSPEGDDYIVLAAKAGQLDLKDFARPTLQPPAVARVGDLEQIQMQAAYLGEWAVFGTWNGDPEFDGEESREVDDAFNSVSNLQNPAAEKFLWCIDPENTSHHWFFRKALASMKTEEKEPLRYACNLCVECLSVEDDDEMRIPEGRRFVTWNCECEAGKDLCMHVRGLAMLAAMLDRPEELHVPKGPTSGANGWKRAGNGVAFNIATAHRFRTFTDNRLHKTRQRGEKDKRSAEVTVPGSVMDHYDPRPDGLPFPSWDSPEVCERRAELWAASKHDRLGVCAAERLFGSRMPAEAPSAEVRAAGDRAREFKTAEQERTAHRSARVGAAAAAGLPRAKNNGVVRTSKLSVEDSVLMLTRVLRQGQTVAQAAYDFDVLEDAAGRIFRSTAKALSCMFTAEYPRPTFGEVRASTPKCFDKKAGTTDTGLMVDATGIQVPHPSNPEMARTMWSEYYEMYAVVTQIGVTPGGCCVWTGPGQSPKLSDTQQCVLAGLLEFVWPGSRLLLDRGYKGMHFPARKKGVRVTMPFFRIRKKKKKDQRQQLGREATKMSKRAAKNRSHNERQMSRLKAFRFFTQMVPLEYKDILDDLVWIAVCLGNLKCPLTDTDAWQVETREELAAAEAQQQAAAEAAAELRQKRREHQRMRARQDAGEEEMQEEEQRPSQRRRLGGGMQLEEEEELHMPADIDLEEAAQEPEGEGVRKSTRHKKRSRRYLQ